MTDYSGALQYLAAMRAASPCEHCRAAVSHFHEDGTGYIYGSNGACLAISYYHQSWGPLTENDQNLPGYQWSRQARTAGNT